MRWAVIIGVDGAIEQAEISGGLLQWLYAQIGCRIVEAVPVRSDDVLGRDDIVMMVDEEALLRPEARLNRTASVLHGGHIYGNAVLLRVGETEDGELDWMGLESAEEAEMVCFKAGVEAASDLIRQLAKRMGMEKED